MKTVIESSAAYGHGLLLAAFLAFTVLVFIGGVDARAYMIAAIIFNVLGNGCFYYWKWQNVHADDPYRHFDELLTKGANVEIRDLRNPEWKYLNGKKGVLEQQMERDGKLRWRV